MTFTVQARLSVTSKIDLYKKYLGERGLLTDMKLIFLTLWKISK